VRGRASRFDSRSRTRTGSSCSSSSGESSISRS
jgi:hypothetical protein